MGYELLIQFRRSLGVYLAIAALTAALAVWRTVTASELSIAAQLCGGLVLWILMLVVAAVDLFSYYWAAQDTMLLLAPWSRGAMLAGKAAIHGSWWLVVFAISWLVPSLGSAGEPGPGIGTLLSVIGARALGIAAFFCLFAVLLRLAKAIRQQALAVAVVLVAYTATTAACMWWVIAATHADGQQRNWMIGLNSGITAPAQYANVLPLVIIPGDAPSPVGAAEPSALLANLLLVAVCLGVWRALRRVPVDFVKYA